MRQNNRDYSEKEVITMEKVKETLLMEIEYFHEIATNESVDSKERAIAHKMEMDATDRLMKLEEAENKATLDNAKHEHSLEVEKKANIMKWVEVVAVPVGVLVLDHLFKRIYMVMVNDFEKDYTYTTSAGKAISSLFKFKK